jgi:hypothetical protein
LRGPIKVCRQLFFQIYCFVAVLMCAHGRSCS